MSSETSRFRPIAVTPDLFVGPAPTSVEDVERLAALGISRLLSLQTDRDLAARGLHWNTLWGLLMARGIRAERQPIIDFDNKDFARHLGAAVDMLDELVQPDVATPRVYVHCTAGINRSPSVILAWLARENGMDAAKSLLAKAHPDAVPYDDLVAQWHKKWLKTRR